MDGEIKEDAPPGVPEWVVTYGDMMSLLLTFFIMLVSLSEVVADEKYRAILDALQQNLGYMASPIAPPGKNFPLNSLVETLEASQLGSFSDDSKGRGGIRKQSTKGDDLKVFRLKEGKPVISGNPINFGIEVINLNTANEKELISIARALVGKPNKLEIRCYTQRVLKDRIREDKERMKVGYDRGQEIKWFLEKQGIEPGRTRITVDLSTESQDDSEINGTQNHDYAEVVVLDEYAASFIGRPSDY